MVKTFRLSLLLLVLFLHAGCSSLLQSEGQRHSYMQSYLQQAEPLILYYPSRLYTDEQTGLLSTENPAVSLAVFYDSDKEMYGLIERFVSESPSLGASSPTIIAPGEWYDLNLSADTPVLFFYVSWQFIHQYFPPDFTKFRLQASVLSKVIPLGQVLSAKGTIAFRSAAWEDTCQFSALNGEYYSIHEWQESAAVRLTKSFDQIQLVCGQELARKFNLSR